MMIKLIDGSIFDSDYDAIVNTVNCAGIMGAGIAKNFKMKYPEMFKQYKLDCARNKIDIGKGSRFDSDCGQIIFNLPTKPNWYDKSTLHYIEQGLVWLRKEIELEGKMSIAIPQLGCGNGGLKWEIVRPIITNQLKGLEHEIYLFN